MPFVYVITHNASGKFYAGSTNSYVRRWVEHKKKLRGNRHHTPPLQAAWNKYGEEAFSFSVVCECNDSNRVFYENLFISKAKYNCKEAAEGCGLVAREKISVAMKGKKKTDSHRKALSKAKLGKKLSPEHSAKIKLHWDEKLADKEWVKKRSDAIKERYKDPALREKMRLVAMKRWGNNNAVR